AELHLRVGEALENTYLQDFERVLPELAHHFTLAAPLGGAARAVDYNRRAAEAAIAAGALGEAVTRVRTALELGIDDPRERVRVQFELANLLSDTGQGPEARGLLPALIDAATRLGQRTIAARALLLRTRVEIGDPGLDLEESWAAVRAAIETLTEL